jgi:hypothetical protein
MADPTFTMAVQSAINACNALHINAAQSNGILLMLS